MTQPSTHTPAPAPSPERRAKLAWLFLGALLIFLSIWKGPGGYSDLGEYLDDAERLWTRGDMASPDPDDYVEVEDPDDPENVIQKPRYNRYAVGLAVVSGPLVVAGDHLEAWTGREGLRRQVAAFTVPLLGAFAVVLAYLLGWELGFHARVCHWGAIVFAFGTPFLSYTRQFFTEIAITVFVLLALYAFLRSARSKTRSFAWLLLAGAGLGAAVGCHYGNVWITAVLWFAFSSSILFPATKNLLSGERVPDDQRLFPSALRVFALTLGPALVLAGLLWLNDTRYGHPLDTGYYKYDVENQIAPAFMLHNFRYAGLWLLRIPWIVLALFFGRKLFARSPALAAGLLVALAVQDLFWMNYQLLGYFPYRYQQSLAALCVPGLFYLGHAILARWPKQGLWFSGVFFVAWNLVFVFSGDDTKSKPFLHDPKTSEWLAYVWYMTPFPRGVMDGYGTALRGTQVTVFLFLVVIGLELLWLAGRSLARKEAVLNSQS